MLKDIERAYAKVNLHLRVLNRRKDGYHDIFSLMALIGLCDLLKLERFELLDAEESIVTVECTGGICSSVIEALPDQDNLIVKAVKRLLESRGLKARAHFSIEKNIPAGAGLGGGSADAAAALRMIGTRLGIKPEELFDTAAGVGADVPFSLFGGAALCEGVGDQMTRVTNRLEYFLVVANCGVHVDTGWAYKELSRGTVPLKSGIEILKEKALIEQAVASSDLKLLKQTLTNDFEYAVFSAYPEVKELKNRLDEAGADFSIMTGSGSTVIGLFKERVTAEDAVSVFPREWFAFVTEFVKT